MIAKGGSRDGFDIYLDATEVRVVAIERNGSDTKYTLETYTNRGDHFELTAFEPYELSEKKEPAWPALPQLEVVENGTA